MFYRYIPRLIFSKIPTVCLKIIYNMFYPALAVISCHCTKDCCGCHAMVHNIAEMPDFCFTLLWLSFHVTVLKTAVDVMPWSIMPDFFKTLLLLQFIFDHSEFFTEETRHIVPPYNKAGISNFCLEFQKLQKFQISSKRYSSFSSYSIILKFLLKKLGIQCHPVTKPEFRISA